MCDYRDRKRKQIFVRQLLYSKTIKMGPCILDAFAKLRKATVSFVMSVRMGKLGSHRTDFDEIVYLEIFRKTVQKIQVSLKSDKNNGCFT